MPRNKRLSRADFSLLLKAKTRRVNGSFFTISALQTKDLTTPKASCVVSKKVSLHAVDRNLIKRRVREIVRPLLSEVTTPTMFMVYAKKECLNASFKELKEDIATIFAQLLK